MSTDETNPGGPALPEDGEPSAVRDGGTASGPEAAGADRKMQERVDALLDEALGATFPASDPVSITPRAGDQ